MPVGTVGMLTSETQSPLTSSCGRLFDAVAALVCRRTHVTYEAQAAIALEACCERRTDVGAYPFRLIENTRVHQSGSQDPCMQIETGPMFVALTEDLSRGVSPGVISRRFHAGLIDALTQAVNHAASRSGVDQVCLSGGSFGNVILSEGLKQKLEALGLTVYTHSIVSPGDGGLSLGQLAVAIASIGESRRKDDRLDTD